MAYNLEQINNKSIHNYKLRDHELPKKSIFQNPLLSEHIIVYQTNKPHT